MGDFRRNIRGPKYSYHIVTITGRGVHLRETVHLQHVGVLSETFRPRIYRSWSLNSLEGVIWGVVL